MGLPKIMPQANMRLAEPTTLEELRRAIDKGPRNKAPGADGIVHEFYGRLWDVITTYLLTTCRIIRNNCRDFNSLSYKMHLR